MKWFISIYAAYILVLGCLPCTDMGHEHSIQTGEEFAISFPAEQPGDHSDCGDWCSPFCQCTCCHCATSVTKLLALQMTTPTAEHRQLSFTYQAPFSTTYRSALFRPPIAFLG